MITRLGIYATAVIVIMFLALRYAYKRTGKGIM